MFGKIGKIDAQWENFSYSKVQESHWKGDFRHPTKKFYKLCTKLQPYFQKKQNCLSNPISIKIQVTSFLYYINVEGRHTETTNIFSVSRGSV